MDALATVLVRSTTEVVAVAASGPNIVAIQDAVQRLLGSDADDNRNYSNIRIPKIAAIVNPRNEDKYEFPNGSSFMMVKEGRSHLARSPPEADAWKDYVEILYVLYYFLRRITHTVSKTTVRTIPLPTISIPWLIFSRSTREYKVMPDGRIRPILQSIWWRSAGQRWSAGSVLGPHKVIFTS